MRAHDFLTERSIKVEIPINITIPQDGSDPKFQLLTIHQNVIQKLKKLWCHHCNKK